MRRRWPNIEPASGLWFVWDWPPVMLPWPGQPDTQWWPLVNSQVYLLLVDSIREWSWAFWCQPAAHPHHPSPRHTPVSAQCPGPRSLVHPTNGPARNGRLEIGPKLANQFRWLCGFRVSLVAEWLTDARHRHHQDNNPVILWRKVLFLGIITIEFPLFVPKLDNIFIA